ncbi:hypothetical protein [Candidatus Thiodiazotropha sp. LNASS1]|uniref:hypothetical protein n=1 Tax=Candidatus Thiodiazotropha sp. LNASS1 TaxID=3096260 RepID=UPI0034DED35D
MDEESKKEILSNFRKRFLVDIIKPAQPALKSIFSGVVKYILPNELVGTISEVIPRKGADTIGLKLELVDGSIYDSITSNMEEIINNNPQELTADRIHEIKVLQKYVRKSNAPFIAACYEKFIIREKDGGDKDDWDGVVLEIYDHKVTITVIEAKNIRPITSRETQAFNQLNTTKKLVNSKRRLSSRRKRLPGEGALITFTL